MFILTCLNKIFNFLYFIFQMKSLKKKFNKETVSEKEDEEEEFKADNYNPTIYKI